MLVATLITIPASASREVSTRFAEVVATEVASDAVRLQPAVATVALAPTCHVVWKV